MNRNSVAFALHAFAVVALGLWMGGLFALGAIAAPVVFRMVPMPDAADAMAVVFARFDKVVIALAAALLVADGSLLLLRGASSSSSSSAPASSLLDRARPLFTFAIAALGIGEATLLTPQIAGLHAGGAILGVGAAGERLEAFHDAASGVGKAELALAVLLVVLHIRAVRNRPSLPVTEIVEAHA